jgi:hypothetical protein
MKKILFVTLATVFTFAINAQNNLGLQGTTPLITTGDLIIKANNSNFGPSKPAAPPSNKPLDPRVSILGAAGQDGIVVRASTSASFNGYAGFFSNTNLGGAPSPKFGVYGETVSSPGAYSLTNYGGYFKATANTPVDNVFGVAGVVESCGPSYAVYGEVIDKAGCPSFVTPKWAGYFKGNTNVTGNFMLGGAFMPNNNAGTVGFILKSNGANVAPSWIDPLTIATPNAWKLNGNSNADGSSFVGTTTPVDLVFKTNNKEALRINRISGSTKFISSDIISAEFTNSNPNGNYINISSALPNFPNINSKAGINFILGTFSQFPSLDFAGGITMDNNFGMQINSISNIKLASGNSIVLNSGNTKSVIISNGKIGIGLDNGQTPLDVLHIKTVLPNTSGILFNNLNSNSPTLELSDKFLTVNANGEMILAKNTNANAINSIQAGNNVTINGAGTTASPYIINANLPNAPIVNWTASTVGSDNITNTNTGGVVIGSGLQVLPSGYKLYVENGILTEKVKVALKSSVNWADYVFNKDYKLKPLAEVEQFVTTNKHLPGVPSATQLVNEGGIDVAQMLSKQMEKIEELTLYLIELNKKVEKLEKENATLKANK